MSEQQDEMTMIGKGLPSETKAPEAIVYADSTIRAAADLKALDARQGPEKYESAVTLTPEEQLQVQVWQAVNFCASNAMLEATTRGDAEDVEIAYKVMDMAMAQMNVAYKKIQEKRGA